MTLRRIRATSRIGQDLWRVLKSKNCKVGRVQRDSAWKRFKGASFRQAFANTKFINANPSPKLVELWLWHRQWFVHISHNQLLHSFVRKQALSIMGKSPEFLCKLLILQQDYKKWLTCWLRFITPRKLQASSKVCVLEKASSGIWRLAVWVRLDKNHSLLGVVGSK